MASLNKVIMVGTLGKIESVNTKTGTPMARISLALTQNFRDANGDWKSKTTWAPCVAFGKQAEVALKFLQKGQIISIEGSFSVDEYTDKNGVQQRSSQIIIDRAQKIAGNKEERAQQTQNTPWGGYAAQDPLPVTDQAAAQKQQAFAPAGLAPTPTDDDAFADDIPFN